MGVLAADNNLVLMAVLLVARSAGPRRVLRPHPRREREGKEPLLSTGLFRNRTSNLGLVTQNVQWLLLMGTSFVVSAYLQVVRGYNAIETGVIFTAATVGILVSSLAAERLAKRHAQRTLIIAGLRHDDRRDRRPARAGEGFAQRVGVRPRAPAHRSGGRRDADPVGERRAVRVPRAASRARSPACRAASPTSARRSARRSPGRSSSRASPRVRMRPR